MRSTPKARLRKKLNDSLRLDSDLNEFCIDYFPDVHRTFSDSLVRTEKLNILLIKKDISAIKEALALYQNKHASQKKPRRASPARSTPVPQVAGDAPAQLQPELTATLRARPGEEITLLTALLQLQPNDEKEYVSSLSRAFRDHEDYRASRHIAFIPERDELRVITNPPMESESSRQLRGTLELPVTQLRASLSAAPRYIYRPLGRNDESSYRFIFLNKPIEAPAGPCFSIVIHDLNQSPVRTISLNIQLSE